MFLIDQQAFESKKDLIKGMDDTEEEKWIKISALQDMELAFDHKEILKDGLKLLGKEINDY